MINIFIVASVFTSLRNIFVVRVVNLGNSYGLFLSISDSVPLVVAHVLP